jgi:ferric-dicitrate binding protein FerR (iron transport regulator)
MAFRPSGIEATDEVTAKETQVQTRMGTRTNLVLPDGTSVWLNAGSVLTYPASFNAPNREVNLDGEAFFDVVKDQKHPFIVHTSTMNIRVLGTSFDVKAYAKDKEMETTLIRGAVEITRKDASDAARILLKPNEKLIFHTSDIKSGMVPISRQVPEVNHLEVTTLQPYKTKDDLVETAWVHNRLEFRGDSFEELSLKLERWYNVQIRFSSEELKTYRFYGSFEKETIVQALDDLKMTAKFNYKINGNDIQILPQG